MQAIGGHRLNGLILFGMATSLFSVQGKNWIDLTCCWSTLTAITILWALKMSTHTEHHLGMAITSLLRGTSMPMVQEIIHLRHVWWKMIPNTSNLSILTTTTPLLNGTMTTAFSHHPYCSRKYNITNHCYQQTIRVFMPELNTIGIQLNVVRLVQR